MNQWIDGFAWGEIFIIVELKSNPTYNWRFGVHLVPSTQGAFLNWGIIINLKLLTGLTQPMERKNVKFEHQFYY